MTMLNQVRKIAKQKTIHMSFRNTLEEGNLYNEIMRRATLTNTCLLYTSPSPRDRTRSRMPSSA